jgi:hypothetical protein
MNEPARAWKKFRDKSVREYQQSPFRPRPMLDWERRLHAAFCITWPCEASLEFQAIWPSINGRARAARVGPRSLARHDYSDAGLSRAIWCLIRHLKPRVVVESGVGQGSTSRCVHEALALNGTGHLLSIDPPPAVPAGPGLVRRPFRIQGSDAGTPSELLSQVGRMDVFVHSSLHTARNARDEADLAWRALSPGGTMIIDDIGSNGRFRSFIEDRPDCRALVCEAEPVHADIRYSDRQRLFAILLKDPTSAA